MMHEKYIRRTFELARLGEGLNWPNPLVGAVIVKNGRVISEGFHSAYGKEHAELDAILKSNESLQGSTLYVNLEPCCHTNKMTPPCAQRIIKEGFAKVYICNLDPNPNVNGKGIELLKSHGIEVIHGILKKEGELLNEVFFTSQRLKRPFVHFKSASSLDGKTAMPSGESKWITGELARKEVHRLRSIHQGIIVGGATVRKDNPHLTVRLSDYRGEQPWRIVFTKSGSLLPTHHLFTDSFKHRTLIYSHNPLSFSFPENQVKYIKTIQEGLEDLNQKKIINLMMESGASLASEFVKLGFIDKITLFQNPSFIGSGRSLFEELKIDKLENRPRLYDLESKWIDQDHCLTGRFKCLPD